MWDLKEHILKGGAIKMGNLSAGSPAWIGHSPHPLGKHHHYKHLEEDILPLDTFFTGWGRWEGEKWGRPKLPALHMVAGHWKANKRDVLKSLCCFLG